MLKTIRTVMVGNEHTQSDFGQVIKNFEISEPNWLSQDVSPSPPLLALSSRARPYQVRLLSKEVILSYV